MKVLLAGDWHSDLHEEPVRQALETLGHQVQGFAWNRYFQGPRQRRLLGLPGALERRLENKYLAGPRLSRLNLDLVTAAATFEPDVVFVYRGTHVKRATLQAIKRRRPSTIQIGYNNDDPFSKQQPAFLWRHFLACLPEYDLALAYRDHNLAELERAGARRVALLRSWYLPERHRPVPLSAEDRGRFECDVVFAGHYEADGRLDCLAEVANQGFRLRVFGPDYPASVRAPSLKALLPIQPVRGDDYSKALCGAKVALSFLSKLNRDTYTRRSFEIPATGTLMLSEYSDDLASLYEEGVEADFFRSKEELVRKLGQYLGDPARRASVAGAGRRRVVADGHDVVTRMRQVLAWAAELQGASPKEPRLD